MSASPGPTRLRDDALPLLLVSSEAVATMRAWEASYPDLFTDDAPSAYSNSRSALDRWPPSAGKMHFNAGSGCAGQSALSHRRYVDEASFVGLP
jgi:hypothetical protein